MGRNVAPPELAASVNRHFLRFDFVLFICFTFSTVNSSSSRIGRSAYTIQTILESVSLTLIIHGSHRLTRDKVGRAPFPIGRSSLLLILKRFSF